MVWAETSCWWNWKSWLKYGSYSQSVKHCRPCSPLNFLPLIRCVSHTRNQFDMYSFVSQSWCVFWQKEWYCFLSYTGIISIEEYHRITYKEDFEITNGTVSLIWYAFLSSVSSDAPFTIDLLRSISFFCQKVTPWLADQKNAHQTGFLCQTDVSWEKKVGELCSKLCLHSCFILLCEVWIYICPWLYYHNKVKLPSRLVSTKHVQASN